ncbi:Deuterolysin metalloprotease family-domain-containing protein [Xylariaceae sp. AK1471]|nr:Deuterolysin metalloprotease family-domain-containing protein [Xylariaceae sp. AK1471]
MRAATIISYLAALADAAAINRNKGGSSLVVRIEKFGNSEVKASITNIENAALRVLRTGSILHPSPVNKVKVLQGTDLQDEAFEIIGATETVEVQWNITQLHDLGAVSEFNITTDGSLLYAEEGGNKIAANIGSAQTAKVHDAFHEAKKSKRIVIQSSYSSSQKSTLNAALSVAKAYAQRPATASIKLQEYFKSTSSSTASTVASIFNKIAASVINSGTSGSTKLYCADVGNFCADGVIAYTQPGSNEYGTDDVCYSYDSCVTTTSASRELNNALYANSI